MDKQIIIDGVDVSGCEYCGYDNVCRLSDYIVDCEDNPNCFYKQLKAKEQECERLEEKYKDKARAWARTNTQILEEHNQTVDQMNCYKQTLTEIKEIACVNPVNTCWTSLNLCDKCEEKEDCEMQSPFAKLKQILEKCEVIDENE